MSFFGSSSRRRLVHGLVHSAVVIAAACLSPALTHAADATFPNRPITLVVPFPAGSGTDAITRIVATELIGVLGQPVIVENKAGGNATIGAQYVARAKPDGYTLLVATNTPLSAAPWLMKSVPYDAIKDFTPVARGGNLPFMLVINPKLPVQSVQDLVALAKKSPGKMNYASGNSTGIVAGATLGSRAGIDVVHVPYKGTPQAMTDVIGGQVDFMFTDFASGAPFVKSGQMRALSVSSAARSALAPDLSSMLEGGVKDFDLVSWNGYVGPAGMPADVIAKLNAAFVQVLSKPEVKARLADLGFDAFSGPQPEFAKFVADQLVLWGELIKGAGIQPE
jgi:tripartite-type tricarboxylate transporter receptor subunit TctC